MLLEIVNYEEKYVMISGSLAYTGHCIKYYDGYIIDDSNVNWRWIVVCCCCVGHEQQQSYKG